MINVRIRHELEPAAVSLGQMPWDPLMTQSGEMILDAILRWGLYAGPDAEPVEGGHQDRSRLSGQFVVDHDAGEAYFEVIVHESEGE
jgi:hypothetical protein